MWRDVPARQRGVLTESDGTGLVAVGLLDASEGVSMEWNDERRMTYQYKTKTI
jgi:hypothetical protein